MRPAVLFLLLALLAPAASAAATVPFVGCPSDGQMGPEAAPRGRPKAVDLDPATASSLAFYTSRYDAGILAPRGWHCVALEGSNGSLLVVTPQAVRAADVLRPQEKALAGPAIQLGISNGGTSGRFEAARIMARYFPGKEAFVRSVIAEGIEPARDFPNRPYPNDKVLRRGPGFVEYLTPPGREGQGTAGRLKADLDPIVGAAMLVKHDPDDSVATVAVRLPPSMMDLAPVILRAAEQRYADVP